MILLVTHGHPTFERLAHPNLGRLIQPRHTARIEDTANAGIPWAADNDCFQGLNVVAFYTMLDRIQGLSGCLFVSCPDVVGDHQATMDLFYRWAPGIARRGLPVGFVLQNGVTPATVPWRDIAAVFVGGDTEFKMGAVAAECVREAKRRGLWAHMGRVNSGHRIRYAASVGCDSIDGTGNSMFPDTKIPTSLGHVAGPVQEMF